MVGSLEHLSAQMMYNASQLSSVLLKKVDQIIKNKRYIRMCCLCVCTTVLDAFVLTCMCTCAYHMFVCACVWVCGCVGVSE